MTETVHTIVAGSKHNDDVIALPLGQMHALDGEWDEGWGRTNEQLVARDSMIRHPRLSTNDDDRQKGGVAVESVSRRLQPPSD